MNTTRKLRKLKELFSQVEDLEKTVYNALKFYRKLEDTVSTLHYELDTLITMEEGEGEGNKDLQCGRDTIHDGSGRSGPDPDYEKDACPVGGSKGVGNVASARGPWDKYVGKSDPSIVPKWGKDTWGEQPSPRDSGAVPGFRDSENGQINEV